MKREWKQGDVALVAGDVAIRVAYSGGKEDRAFVDGLGRHWRHEDDTARPLVVIDPEDDEQVERLYREFVATVGVNRAFALQTALREFANPSLPEPKATFARVLNDEGVAYYRSPCGKWHRESDDLERPWDHIAAVRVLSEGVQ